MNLNHPKPKTAPLADPPTLPDIDVASGLIELARSSRTLGHSSPRGVRAALFDIAARLDRLAGELTGPR